VNIAPQTNARLTELEALRGVASWWVVVGHVAYTFSDRLGHVINNRSAVDLFFILSGFVIFALMDRKPEPYPTFVVRRFFRIYPAFIFVVLVSAVFLQLQIDALADAPFVTARTATRLTSLQSSQAYLPTHLALHGLMLHGLVPTTVLPFSDIAILGQGWSIGVEWVFYLMAPLFLRIGKRPGVGLYVALALVAALWFAQRIPGFAENSAFVGSAAPWLAVGALSYFLRKHMVANAQRWLWPLVVLGMVAAVGLKSPGLLIWVLAWPVVVGHQGVVTNLARRILNTPLLTWLGKTSYSTYLVHMLAMYLSMSLASHLHMVGAAYAGLVVAGTLGLTALACAIMYPVIELPFIELGAKIAGRLRLGGRAAASLER
jgi:peptidoglycan/LPS O-acetylase OafA/YrhL